MAYFDPTGRTLLRLEVRRYVGRCQNSEGLAQRADTLRELSRLAATTVPYKIADEYEARDAQRHLVLVVEDRAKELILEQISGIFKVEENARPRLRSKFMEDLSNLVGALSHLRAWAKGKLLVAEQSA